MTETAHEEQPPPPQPPSGIHTEHLRDYRAFRRSVTDRKIAGVAGGLGRHLAVDPLVLRVLLVVLVFFGGAGLVLYGAAWLLVPQEGRDDAPIRVRESTRNALLIAAAVIAALSAIGDSVGHFGFPWPLAVAALVLFAVLLGRDNSRPTAATYPPGYPPPAPYPADRPEGSEEPTAPYESAGGYGPPVAYGPPGGYYAAPPPRPDRGPLLFGVTLALVAVALGALGIYEAAGGDVADAAYPALALAVVGAMLVVGAWFGRPGGLVLLGLVATVALAGTALAQPRFDGDRAVDAAPTSASAVRAVYEVPAGEVTLDLTRVEDLENLDGRDIRLAANAGELIVLLPSGVAAEVDAQIEYGGAVDLPEDSRGGFGVEVQQEVGDTAEAIAVVDLTMDLKFGHIEVRQQ